MNSVGSRFPWRAAMAVGFGVLHLPSDAFWRLTLRELAAAMDAYAPAPRPPSRAVLRDLMRRFPDREEKTDADEHR